jgi:hypothetical protein
MARHDGYAGQGLGPILIARAFESALIVAASVATFALIVDAKNDALCSWYASLGFQSCVDQARTLFIVNETIRAYLQAIEAASVSTFEKTVRE